MIHRRLIATAMAALILTCVAQRSGLAQAQGIDILSYFPQAVDTQWVYHVETGTRAPVLRRMTKWPMDGANQQIPVVVVTRENFEPEAKEPQDPKVLEIRVKRSSTPPAFPKDPIEIEYEILRDDLGFYRGHHSVKTEIRKIQNLWMVMQNVSYDKGSLRSPPEVADNPDIKFGYQERFLFFWKGGSLTLDYDDHKEDLNYINITDSLPGYKGQQVVRFRRFVKPEDSFGPELGQAISEDYWYAPQVGLVKFNQKIGDELSVSVRLVQFQKGVSENAGGGGTTQ